MFKKIILSVVATTIVLQGQTLEQSVKHVLETNPVVLERLANYKETSKDLSIANSEYLPTIDLLSSVGYEAASTHDRALPTNDADDETAYYENSLTVMWNIFEGFGTSNKVDYQKSRIVASAYNFIEKANDTTFEITRRYIEILKQHELLLNARENVEINENIFAKVNDLYKNGLTTKSEVRKIESSLFLARSNFVVQENNAMDAMFNFKKTLGAKVDVDSLEIPSFKVYLPKTLEEATAYSIRNNPSIMVSNYNIKAAQYLREESQKDYYPKIDLMAQQNLDRNTYGSSGTRDRFRAGVVLSYNLYRGGSDQDRIEQTTSAIHRDVQTRNELQRQTIEGLELSWSAAKMTLRQLVELEKYREYSEETLNLYKEEYDIGRRTLLDLLSAQHDFINSKSQIITAEYDNLFAKYRILDSMGLLVAGIMGNQYDYMERVGLTGVDAVDNTDTLPISYDEDNDNLSALEDECPASLDNENILSNGCKNFSMNPSEIKHFELLSFNRVDENTSSEKNLKDILDSAKNNNEDIDKIIIQAHSSMTYDVNDDINASKNYANSVKKSLTKAGVDSQLIEIEANGSNSPISSDESLNDRVNVIIYLK